MKDQLGSRVWEYFFSQAEDGIRDTSVTGVQTCALPISIALAGWRRTRCVARATWSAASRWAPRSSRRSATTRRCGLLSRLPKRAGPSARLRSNNRGWTRTRSTGCWILRGKRGLGSRAGKLHTSMVTLLHSVHSYVVALLHSYMGRQLAAKCLIALATM